MAARQRDDLPARLDDAGPGTVLARADPCRRAHRGPDKRCSRACWPFAPRPDSLWRRSRLESVMSAYEYKVVPAPRRAERIKGVPAPEMRFAMSVEKLMNTYAAEGWEYVRADTLPSEERRGLGGRHTEQRTLLVFRRAVAERAADPAPWFGSGRTSARDAKPQQDGPTLHPVEADTPGRGPRDAEERIAIPGVLRAEPEHDERGVADKPAGRRLWAVRPEDDETR
ncbi:DUF4177 domain-containing protein [Rhodosalinus sp.]|uniref:DUF4177 domain-containing protein n=1 Tax=Rhodosalinus sp. TaxID=2047741 RepID=UPI0039791E41